MTDRFEKLKELKQLLDEKLIDNQEYFQLKKELFEGNNKDVSNPDRNQEEEENQVNKSYCPNCGSSDIQLQRNVDQEINWGRAVAGWALFGIVGGAVAGATGNNRESFANTCLNCGTVWRAEDIYKIKELIRELTNFEINISIKQHRKFLNKFINEISPYFQQIEELKKRQKQLDIKKEDDKVRYYFNAVLIAFVITFLIAITIDGIDEKNILPPFIIVGILLSSFIGTIVLSNKIYDNGGGSEINTKYRQIENEIQDISSEIERRTIEFYNQNQVKPY